MRKVKLSMQMTINGYVGGPNGENDWMTRNPDDEFMEFLNSNFDSSDTILLGRKMTDGFVSHWENAVENDPDTPFAKKMVNTPKVVFTKTLDKVAGKNISLFELIKIRYFIGAKYLSLCYTITHIVINRN